MFIERHYFVWGHQIFLLTTFFYHILKQFSIFFITLERVRLKHLGYHSVFQRRLICSNQRYHRPVFIRNGYVKS